MCTVKNMQHLSRAQWRLGACGQLLMAPSSSRFYPAPPHTFTSRGSFHRAEGLQSFKNCSCVGFPQAAVCSWSSHQLCHTPPQATAWVSSGDSAPAPATPPPPPSSLSWVLTGLFLTPFFLTSHCQAPFCLFLSLSSQKHRRHGWRALGHPVAWPL